MPPKKTTKRAATDKPAAAAKKAKASTDGNTDTAELAVANGVEHAPSDSLDFTQKYRCESGQVKLVSWNVNGLRALLKKETLLEDYVKAEDPDVICLQETKIDDSLLDQFKSMCKGYHQIWYCSEKPGYSGTAMFSKAKPLSVVKGLGKPEHDDEGRCIIAEFPTFYLVNCYVPNAGQALERLDYRTQQWDVDLKARLKALEKTKPVVLTGDLNVAHNDIDIHNPKTNQKSAGFTPQERARFTELLGDGFVDTYRAAHPDRPQYTYWGYRFNARMNNKGWRLDYFVVSDCVKDKVKETFVRGTVGGSDHCPIGIVMAA